MAITVNGFLELFKNKQSEDYLDIASRYHNNIQLINSLIISLETNKFSPVSDNITEVIYVLLCHGNNDSEIFCMNFIPTILWLTYYQIATRQNIQSSSKIDAILLNIYNKVVDVNEEEKNIFRIPVINKSSIFHEAGTIQANSGSVLTEHSLSQHNAVNEPITIKGPTKHIDRITAGLRSLIVKTVLQEYNAHLNYVTESSLLALCNLVVRLSSCGFRFEQLSYDWLERREMDELSHYAKVKLHSNIIQQLITAIHFALYNGQAEASKSSLKYLRKRCAQSLTYSGFMNCSALQDLCDLSKERNDYFYLPVLDPGKMKYRTPKQKKPLEERRPTIIRAAKVSTLTSPTNATSSPMIRLSEFDMKLEDEPFVEIGQENIPLQKIQNGITNSEYNMTSSSSEVKLSHVQLRLENDDPKNQLTAIQENYDKSSDKVPLILQGGDNSSTESEPHVIIKDTGSVTLLTQKSATSEFNREQNVIESKT